MITLKPIKATFTQTLEVKVDEYLEYCFDYDITPSQKGYKKYVIETFEDYLNDEIADIDNFKFEYGKEEEHDYKPQEPNGTNAVVKVYNYEKHISDLTEEEISEFHELCEMDKLTIHPFWNRNNIVVFNNYENPSLHYAVKLDGNTKEILDIKKSTYGYFLYEYMKTL